MTRSIITRPSACLGGHLIAVPFRNLGLDDPSGYVVLRGASRSALEKLPVFVEQ
jgi:hypothetical protein